MAKRSATDQLDQAVGAMLGDPDAPLARLSPRLAALLRVAADLRGLPSAEFKTRLKAELLSGKRRKPDSRGAAERRPAKAAKPKAKPAPQATPTAMTCLIVKGAPRAIDFYKQVFGATELIRHTDPQGHVMHAEIAIGDTRIALADEEGEYNRSPLALGGSPAIMQLRVDDADAVAERAVAAGARLIFPVADQFYGERSGRLADPFGHLWIISTHIEDVSPEELARRAEAYAKERAAAAPAKQSPAPVREGFSSLTPFIFADDLPRMVDFMKDAFDAEETLHEIVGDPPHTHSEVRVGDSMVMLGDSSQKFPANPSAFHLYVEDADAAYKRALRVGATSMYKPTDQEYGDREAGVKDRFGNHWYIGTHKEGSYIPRGLRSLTMSLHPKGAPKVIDFLKRVFDAEEVFAARDDAGTVHHAKIRIGDAMLEMGEAHGPFQPMPPALYLYVSDVDATYRRALEAGAVSMTEPRDQAYGDRMAAVKDPFGNIWFIATQKKSAA